jgi:hypothetical protein
MAETDLKISEAFSVILFAVMGRRGGHSAIWHSSNAKLQENNSFY